MAERSQDTAHARRLHSHSSDSSAPPRVASKIYCYAIYAPLQCSQVKRELDWLQYSGVPYSTVGGAHSEPGEEVPVREVELVARLEAHGARELRAPPHHRVHARHLRPAAAGRRAARRRHALRRAAARDAVGRQRERRTCSHYRQMIASAFLVVAEHYEVQTTAPRVLY